MALVVASQPTAERQQWQEALDALPVRDVEEALQRTELRPGEQTSILDYLRSPGADRTKAEALKDVLEKLGDRSEDVAVTTSLVWRYAKANALWDTHANPQLRDPEAFLANLTNNQVVRLNIVFGTSTTRARQSSLRVIEQHWGSEWFNQIPAQIRPPLGSPTEAPKRLLIEIAATCKKGISLERAAPLWEEAVNTRTDEDLRRQANSRASRALYITTADVAKLNKSARLVDVGRRPVELYLPELHEDRIELKDLQPTQTTSDKGPSKRGQGQGNGTSRSKKSKRTREGPAVNETDTMPTSQQSDPPQSAQTPQMPQCYSNLVAWHVEALLALDTNRNYACCDTCQEAVEGILEPLSRQRVQAMLELIRETEVHYIEDEIVSPAPEPKHRRTTTLL